MANMTTKTFPPGPGFDALVRVLHSDPRFLRARLKEASAKIRELESRIAERDQTISDLLDRLSESRRKAAEA
jgi:hypothetical protein